MTKYPSKQTRRCLSCKKQRLVQGFLMSKHSCLYSSVETVLILVQSCLQKNVKWHIKGSPSSKFVGGSFERCLDFRMK